VIFERPVLLENKDKAAQEAYCALSKVRYFFFKSQRMADTLTYLKSTLLESENRIYATDEIRIVTELLILQLVQRISNPDKSSRKMSSAEIQRVYLIDEFFNKNFHHKDGDVMLDKKLGVSIRQLNRVLKNLYGCNFREKLKEIRLEIALDLLTTSKSISEISDIIGYSCPANFSTFIKNTTGRTPSELRLKRFARNEKSEDTLV